MKENLSESTKLFLKQRNFFFNYISKKCLFASNKILSSCIYEIALSFLIIFSTKYPQLYLTIIFEYLSKVL